MNYFKGITPGAIMWWSGDVIVDRHEFVILNGHFMFSDISIASFTNDIDFLKKLVYPNTGRVIRFESKKEFFNDLIKHFSNNRYELIKTILRDYN